MCRWQHDAAPIRLHPMCSDTDYKSNLATATYRWQHDAAPNGLHPMCSDTGYKK